MKTFFTFLVLCLFGNSLAQRAMDTVDTKLGKIVVYSNQNWELIQEDTFDGVLNPQVHEIMNSKEIGGPYTMKWDDNDCYSRVNDLTKMKDTVWLCLDGDSLGNFTMPIDGPVTSRYKYRNGKFHNGIDLDLVTGDTVVSAFDGIVRYARKNSGGYGNLVIIRHFNGLETYYAHLSKLLVFSGQQIKSGEVLGLGGNTGHSFGSHLHFEVRFYDAAMNPEELIDFKKKELKSTNLLLHKTMFRPGVTPSDQWKKKSNGSKEYVAKKYYKVRAGDTLSRIAERHRTSVSTLCRLNGLRSTSILQIGQNLRVK
ncbi:M23 family metallopeptidase [Crocinitomicaceae bacterium]|nr:M23 family metallopeptidase [Crocinitomicaceae bacterium]MDG2505729.1 M23 family metallopeptidase [Crocinitomicaceae bacterium]